MRLLSSKQKSETNSGERGVAFTELAIVLPPLMLLCAFVFDFGMAIDRYLTLTRISYEAARYGAQLGGLEALTFSQQNWDPLAVRPQIHEELHERIDQLVIANELALSNIRVVTSLQTGAVPDFIVEVSITGDYQSFFDQVGTIQLGVVSRAPFLYPGV